MEKFLIVDAHEDLAWNILTLGVITRFLRSDRQREQGGLAPAQRWHAARLAMTSVTGGGGFSTLFCAPVRQTGRLG